MTRVVVTGAGSGIGKAIAERMAAEGAKVVVNDLDPEAGLRVASVIGATAVIGDAASGEGVEALYSEAKRAHGGIDIWFGNAGIENGRGLNASEDAWKASFEVNVMAHVRAARLLVPHWIEAGGGRYVVTASAAGLLTMLDAPTYSVSKHGAVAFAEWLSATYRHKGIVVQAICPQGVRTPMLAAAGGVESVLSHDAALEPSEVAERVWEALSDNQFLILPHPEVAEYSVARANDRDRWLNGMNKLQRRLEEQRVVS